MECDWRSPVRSVDRLMRSSWARIGVVLACLGGAGCELPELEPFDGPYDPDNPANALPEAPGDLSARVGNTSVELKWTAVDGAVGYAVFRATPGGGDQGLAEVTDTTYVDREGAAGESYGYAVVALSPEEVEGRPARMAGVVPGRYGIRIDGGALATAAPVVNVSAVGPAEAVIAGLSVAESPELAEAAAPTAAGSSVDYDLGGDDGDREVWVVLYLDGGATTEPLTSTIHLDRVAEISGIQWCVNEVCDEPDSADSGAGDLVKFSVETSEKRFPARVLLTIGGFDNDRIHLLDSDRDGVYEGELNTALTDIRTTEITGTVTATLVDAVGNSATPATSTERLAIF